MVTENKHTENYAATEVNTLVMEDLRQSVMIVSLIANLALFVTWLVVVAS